MNEAQAAGLKVDERLSEWNRWSLDFVLRDTDKTEGNKERATERADDTYQMLLAGSANHATATTTATDGGGTEAYRQKLVSLLLLGQQEDGSWSVPSTLKEMENKPMVVSNDWGTSWAVIGLMRTMGR
jgi:hypothetical protein